MISTLIQSPTSSDYIESTVSGMLSRKQVWEIGPTPRFDTSWLLDIPNGDYFDLLLFCASYANANDLFLGFWRIYKVEQKCVPIGNFYIKLKLGLSFSSRVCSPVQMFQFYNILYNTNRLK